MLKAALSGFVLLGSSAMAQDCSRVTANHAEDCGLNSVAEVGNWTGLNGTNPRFDPGQGIFGAGAYLGTSVGTGLQLTSPCAAATPSTDYASGGWIRSRTPGVLPECRIALTYHSQAGCAGGGSTIQFMFQTVGETYDFFEFTGTTFEDTVAMTQLLSCSADSPFEINFDEATLVPYRIFENEFE